MHKIKVFVILIEHFPNHCKISEDEEDAGMYFNSGYLNNSRLDFKDYSKPLVVGSCGTYRLKNALSYLLLGKGSQRLSNPLCGIW